MSKRAPKPEDMFGGKKDKPEGHTFHFISGLPRSGSTLLANILAQNPRFHSSSTSGILDIMFGVRNSWNQLVEFQATPNPEGELRVLKGIIESYYSEVKQPVIFDKSRGWTSMLEMAEKVLDIKAKVLVPVRDMRDVLASFEKLWRENAPINQLGQESSHYFQFQTMQGRCEVWLEANQPVGLAYNRITDALNRGFTDRMFFIDFDDLTNNPKRTMEAVYKFLGEEYYDHDFNNVKQVTWEDDAVHGFKGLHDIRPKVEPIPPRWPKILGPFAEKYGGMNFWKKSAQSIGQQYPHNHNHN